MDFEKKDKGERVYYPYTDGESMTIASPDNDDMYLYYVMVYVLVLRPFVRKSVAVAAPVFSNPPTTTLSLNQPHGRKMVGAFKPLRHLRSTLIIIIIGVIDRHNLILYIDMCGGCVTCSFHFK